MNGIDLETARVYGLKTTFTQHPALIPDAADRLRPSECARACSKHTMNQMHTRSRHYVHISSIH